MKTFKLISLLLLSPLTFFAQTSLNGLWVGTMSNDSNTVRKEDSFEIALAEYRGKVTGYSRSTFIVNDTLYYVVKRVKGTINGDVCEVKDDEIVSYNFPKRIDKGVKVISTFRRNKQDSTWYLEGDWKTNQTKKYYSITGKLDLKEEKDYASSKLFSHLEELSLVDNVPFYQESKKESETKLVKTTIRPQSQKAINTGGPGKPSATSVKTNTVAVNRDVVMIDQKTETTFKPEAQSAINKDVAGKPNASSVKTNTVAVDRNVVMVDQKTETTFKPEAQSAINKDEATKPGASSVKTNTVAVDRNVVMVDQKTETTFKPEAQSAINKDVATKPGASSVKTNTVAVDRNVVMIDEKTETSFKNETQTGMSKDVAGKPNASTVKTSMTPVNNTISAPSGEMKDPSGPAAYITDRKMNQPTVVTFASDSLVLALYDNGEIDGDTVSVLLNGEIFISKQGLKATAMKKTIYITPGEEEITLILYAENLGKYPPNTGLLMVYDGEERHQIHFSADLTKNAAVVFRRKK
jgi:hypothetical protein